MHVLVCSSLVWTVYYRKSLNFNERVMITLSVARFTNPLAAINDFNHCCTKIYLGSSKLFYKPKSKYPNWNTCFGTVVWKIFNIPRFRSIILVLNCKKLIHLFLSTKDNLPSHHLNQGNSFQTVSPVVESSLTLLLSWLPSTSISNTVLQS